MNKETFKIGDTVYYMGKGKRGACTKKLKINQIRIYKDGVSYASEGGFGYFGMGGRSEVFVTKEQAIRHAIKQKKDEYAEKMGQLEKLLKSVL